MNGNGRLSGLRAAELKCLAQWLDDLQLIGERVGFVSLAVHHLDEIIIDKGRAVAFVDVIGYRLLEHFESHPRHWVSRNGLLRLRRQLSHEFTEHRLVVINAHLLHDVDKNLEGFSFGRLHERIRCDQLFFEASRGCISMLTLELLLQRLCVLFQNL